MPEHDRRHRRDRPSAATGPETRTTPKTPASPGLKTLTEALLGNGTGFPALVALRERFRLAGIPEAAVPALSSNAEMLALMLLGGVVSRRASVLRNRF